MRRLSLLIKSALITVFVMVFLPNFLLFPGVVRTEEGRDIIILNNTLPDCSITANSNVTVYGTAQSNQVTIEGTARVELINFPGNNTVQFLSEPEIFKVFRSGAMVTFEGSDGTLCRIPATTSVQTIRFSDDNDLELQIQENRVKLANLTVTADKADIPDTTPATPALIQPGDLVYQGAFRLPGASGGSNWEYSGTALTWYPHGDPDGASDGFPGSLFGAGHDHHMQVSEITIPEPVVAADPVTFDPATLNTAVTLQPFADITAGLFDMSALEIPGLGLAYLPAQNGSGDGNIAFCVGQHFQDFQVSHGLAGIDLSHPVPSGPWSFDGITNYASNDYLTAIPEAWSTRYTPGMTLASGRFREGVWGGLGPALFAYNTYNEDGSLPSPNSTLSQVTPLLLYGTQVPGGSDIVSDPSQEMMYYQTADHWLGTAWLTSGARSALIFTGTKAVGRSWYGFANGVEWPYDCADHTPPTCPEVPDWPYDNRGYWAETYEAWVLFYDPEDLGSVAAGRMETWEPQPYATLDITSVLFDPQLNHAEYKRDLIGAAAFDYEKGTLYIVERLADDYQSVIHVWQIR